MDFDINGISRAFWHHFTHLRVVDVDDQGIEIRVLAVTSCIACRRLWDTLTPVTIGGREIFPAARAERYRPFGRQAFLRDDHLAGAQPRRSAAELQAEPVSYARIRRFTDWEARKPLERY